MKFFAESCYVVSHGLPWIKRSRSMTAQGVIQDADLKF